MNRRCCLLFFKWILFSCLYFGCSGKVLKFEKEEVLKKNEEFDSQIKIVEVSPEPRPIEPLPPSSASPTISVPTPQTPGLKKDSPSPSGKKPPSAKDKGKDSKTTPQEGKASGLPPQREPELEDREGFWGRRPIKDPFEIGEEVTHRVFYDASLFDLPAGTMTFAVAPFVEVNGKKSYQFKISLKSSPWFSSYYSVDDLAVTLVDFEELIPRVFTMHIKESSQLREARSIFDFDKLQATYWEKKVTKKSGIEEKKQQWEILPYSQNVFSAAFYLRLFKWDLDKEYAFRVSDEEQNLIFRGAALAKETIKTELGPMKAIKIKPQFTVKGVFKDVGNIFIWVSDDDKKYILRVETKIKIGSLVSEVVSIKKSLAGEKE